MVTDVDPYSRGISNQVFRIPFWIYFMHTQQYSVFFVLYFTLIYGSAFFYLFFLVAIIIDDCRFVFSSLACHVLSLGNGWPPSVIPSTVTWPAVYVERNLSAAVEFRLKNIGRFAETGLKPNHRVSALFQQFKL
jgi:hypothetical protein